MGRPIKRSKMGGDVGFGGALGGKIAVSNYRQAGSNTASTTAYIVSQRGSKQFKIHLEDSSEAVYTLVTKATLTDNNTFNVKLVLDDSTEGYVEKFYNNTVHYVTADGATTGTIKYQLNAEGSDEGQVSGVGNIDVR